MFIGDEDNITLSSFGQNYDRYMGGTFPYNKTETAVIPVTEMKLRFTYALGKLLGTNVFLGVGGFASAWWNVPMAPTWSVPGNWTLGDGTGWKENRSTLLFYGGTAGLKFVF